MNKTVKKAVILAGGLGTRMLPVTKSMAKEVFPILNKPAMQLIVEELADSGIEEAIIVINKTKKMIMDHFTKDKVLEKTLEERNQFDLLEEVKKINRIKTTFAFQHEALGSAHAVACAKPYLKKGEPFIIIYGDDLIYNDKTPVTKQLLDCYNKYGKMVMAGQEVPKEQVVRYGMLVGNKKEGRTTFLTDIVEKPKLEDVTSTFVSLGSVVAEYEFFDEVEKLMAKSQKGKLYLVNAADILGTFARQGKMVGYNFEGTRYDLGSTLGYAITVIDYALRDSAIGPKLREHLEKIITSDKKKK